MSLHLSAKVRDAAVAEAAQAFNVEAEQILSPRRPQAVAWARHYAMWQLRAMQSDGRPKYSLLEIGRAFGMDHASVLYGVRAHERRFAEAMGEAA